MWNAITIYTLLFIYAVLHSIITRVIDNDKVEVEIAENVTVEVIRGTGIQSLMSSQEVKK